MGEIAELWDRYMAWLLARWCRKCVEHGDG
jgi:hypothetical protein